MCFKRLTLTLSTISRVPTAPEITLVILGGVLLDGTGQLRLQRLVDLQRSAKAASEVLESKFLELGLDRFRPNLVTLLSWVEGVGHDFLGENTFGGEKFI